MCRNVTKYFLMLTVCGGFSLSHSQITTSEPKTSPPPALYPPQVPGLEGEAKSGPIVLVDQRTLYITNFRFDGQKNPDAHFVVGQGTEPDSNGIHLEDENGSRNNLRSYQGENIYVQLRQRLDQIDYFAVWSELSGDLGHVFLSTNVTSEVSDTLGFEKSTTDGKLIMRVPKCCPFSEIVTLQGCRKIEANFRPEIAILEHNATHIDNESLALDKYTYQPYIFENCPSGNKYPLFPDVDNFALLKNGSLILKSILHQGVLSQGEFCIDNMFLDNISMSVLVCIVQSNIKQAGILTYFIKGAVVISTGCFAISFAIYLYMVQNCTKIHKNCFMVYSLLMCLNFLILAIVQFMDPRESGCKVLGFLFEFAITGSFGSLAVLCVDNCLLIRNFKGDLDKQKSWRFLMYLGVVSIFPSIFLIVGLARSIPNIPQSFLKPQYVENGCYFDAESQVQLMFYLYLSFALVLTVGSLAYSKYLIVLADRNHTNHVDWVENSRKYKFMCRRYFIVFVVMSVWLIDGWMSAPYASTSNNKNGLLMAFNLIEACQGIIIVLLFVLNEEVKREIVKVVRRRRHKPVLDPRDLGIIMDNNLTTPINS